MNTNATQEDQAVATAAMHLRDEETGLLRAHVFVNQLDARLNECSQSQQTVALLQLSFGGLSVLNETLGDHVTEALLMQIAGILRPLESEGWLLGSMAHDRFLVAGFGCSDKGDAMAAIGDLLQRFSESIFVEGMELHLTPQAGAALFPLHGGNAQRLMLSARQALTRAMATEHNGVLLYSEELGLQAQRETRLTVDLRSAITRKQMSLTYEPQIDLRTGELVAVDAVVVWNHPEYGMIDQTQIMVLADQTAQIITIGEWIVSQAVAEIQKVQKSTGMSFRVCSSISPKQFRQADGIARLTKILRDNNFPPAMLEIQFTEAALRAVDRSTQETLYRLKDMGVFLTLDDFGTGYSSLSFLKSFPIDRIKIHGSFIQNIARKSEDHAVVRAILSMAQSLKIGSVADGIEKETQHSVVARMGCEFGQGGLYAKSMDVSELVTWVMSYSPGSMKSIGVADEAHLKTILLVDDEANVLSALKRLLRRDGYNILSTTSAAEAFELLATNRVGVIVSDQRMPEMNGTEFLAQVKEIYPNTMRMVLSGYTELQSVTDAINRGSIYKFLTKPWDDEQLRANIAEAFRRLQMELENAALHQEVETVNTELVRLNHILEQRVMEKNERIARDTDHMLVLQEVLDNVTVGVLGIDSEGEIALSNQQADAWLSPENKTLVSESIGELPQALSDALGEALLTVEFDGGQLDFSHQGESFRATLSPMGRRSLSKGVLVTMSHANGSNAS